MIRQRSTMLDSCVDTWSTCVSTWHGRWSPSSCTSTGKFYYSSWFFISSCASNFFVFLRSTFEKADSCSYSTFLFLSLQSIQFVSYSFLISEEILFVFLYSWPSSWFLCSETGSIPCFNFVYVKVLDCGKRYFNFFVVFSVITYFACNFYNFFLLDNIFICMSPAAYWMLSWRRMSSFLLMTTLQSSTRYR